MARSAKEPCAAVPIYHSTSKPNALLVPLYTHYLNITFKYKYLIQVIWYSGGGEGCYLAMFSS